MLAPVLALVAAVILGLAALHFNPGLATGPAAPKVAHTFSQEQFSDLYSPGLRRFRTAIKR